MASGHFSPPAFDQYIYTDAGNILADQTVVLAVEYLAQEQCVARFFMTNSLRPVTGSTPARQYWRRHKRL